MDIWTYVGNFPIACCVVLLKVREKVLYIFHEKIRHVWKIYHENINFTIFFENLPFFGKFTVVGGKFFNFFWLSKVKTKVTAVKWLYRALLPCQRLVVQIKLYNRIFNFNVLHICTYSTYKYSIHSHSTLLLSKPMSDSLLHR
jgi:hypothetical protein